MKVDRDDFGDPSNDRVAAGETPAIPCTIPDCDDPFGIRDGMIGALQCVAHVLCATTLRRYSLNILKELGKV